MCLDQCHIKTPADTTTTISVSVCPICGISAKSGKMSCCARGGSWFKSCGGAGNTELQHTWYEGIQACKGQLKQKKIIDQHLNVVQQKGIAPSQGASVANYEAVIAAAKAFEFTSVNTSTPISDTTSIVASTYTPENVSNTAPSRTLTTNTATNPSLTSPTHASCSTSLIIQSVLKIIVHINLLFIIVF